MKDILGKLSDIEATAPKAKAMLTEDAVAPMIEEKKAPSFKEVFEMMATNQPVPVVGKEGSTQSTGAGFINVTDTSPAAQALAKAVGDLASQKKLQIVVPTTGQQAAPNAPKPVGTTGTTQGGQGQAMGAGQAMREDDLDERDEGKPGKNFAKIAKSAAKRYGSKEAGERVAGAVRAKLAKQGKLEEVDMEEGAGAKDWHDDMEQWALNKGRKNTGGKSSLERAADRDKDWALSHRKSDTVKEEQLDEKFASQQQAKLMYATAGGADTGVSKKVAKEFIKKSHGQKVGKLPKKVDEILNVKLSKRDPSEETKWNRNGWPLIKQPSAKAHLGAAQYHDEQANKWKEQFRDALKNPDMPEKGKEAYKWEIQRNNQEAKRHRLAAKNFDAVKEADIPSTQGIDTQGVNLGAGRSMTTLEAKEPQVEVIDNAFNRENYKDLIGKKYPKSKAPAYARVKEISEGAKPDFLDLDKDGNKKESMKKAAADKKKKKKVDESMNHRISAARLEGKSHGLRGHAHSGKRYEDLEELKAYHEGYKEGLDECYGQGVYEAAPAMPPATVGGMAKAAMEADLDEMDRSEYMKSKARTTPGDTFKAFGQTMHDKDVLEYAFESAEMDESIFRPDNKIGKELRFTKNAVGDAMGTFPPIASTMGAAAGLGVGPQAAAMAGAAGAAYLPFIGAAAASAYGMFKVGQLTGKVLNFLAQKFFGSTEEALAFAKEHLAAAKAGEESFQHKGKSYKVTLKPDQVSSLENDIMDMTQRVKDKEFDKPNTMMGKIGKALAEDPVFESWDSQLKALVNESSEVNEGMSVSISKGQQNSPDSVTITAQDQEADELLAFVKQAGLGLFGADKEPSSAMSIQPSSHGAPDEVGAGGVDVEVIDGHDGIMGLMQKLSGIQADGQHDADYADEEGHKDCGCEGDCKCDEETNEAMCNECGGMMEAGHSCGGKEMVDEVESEEQQEYEVAEDNAPDSGAADSVADEDAEAAEDAALAKSDMQNKTSTVNEEDDEEAETVSESFSNLFKKLDMIAEESTEKKDEKAEKAGKKVAKDIEYDEGHKGKDDDKAEKAGKKVTKDIEYDDKKDKVDESEQLDELSAELLNKASDAAWERGRKVDRSMQPDEKAHRTFGQSERNAAGKFWQAKADKFATAAAAANKRDTERFYHEKEREGMSPAQRKQFDKMKASGELNEWANQVGNGPGKGTDASFEQDIEFMTKVIAGGLNKPKSTGQTTVPVIAGQDERMHDNPQDWATLAGIKK